MRSRIFNLLGVICLLSVPAAFGQDAASDMPAGYPAASWTEMNCSGFISAQAVSKDLYLFGGADNDTENPVRAWWTGEHVFLRSRTGGGIAVGNEFSLVRSASELMRVRWYEGQGASVRSLGKPYENVGRVKVVRVTPEGAIAEVTSACTVVMRGDLAIPVVNRPVPSFTPTTGSDRYPPYNGKILGAITAGVDNSSFFGNSSRAYINLGTSDGIAPGARFRIFHIFREERGGTLMAPIESPRQTTGELVVLHCEENSSVAIVVRAIREIKLGDGIELQ